jgi:hypothetical protein
LLLISVTGIPVALHVSTHWVVFSPFSNLPVGVVLLPFHLTLHLTLSLSHLYFCLVLRDLLVAFPTLLLLLLLLLRVRRRRRLRRRRERARLSAAHAAALGGGGAALSSIRVPTADQARRLTPPPSQRSDTALAEMQHAERRCSTTQKSASQEPRAPAGW